jgi:hypothetical protein
MSSNGMSETSNKESERADSDTGTEPQIFSSTPSPERAKENSDQHNNRTRHVYLKRDFIDRFNTVVIFLAFVAAVYAGWQATRLGDLTQSAMTDTREALKLDQRAWLGVESFIPNPTSPERGKTFVVKIAVKNTGKTPAINLFQRGSSEPLRSGDYPNFVYEQGKPGGIIAPGAFSFIPVVTMTVPETGTPLIVNDDIINGLSGKSFTVYVSGIIEYGDIFNRRHWLTYCGFWDGDGFAACKDHNDTGDY